MPIRVLIADDHRLLRQGVVALLSQHSDISVVGESADGLEAIQKAEQLKPDVIVMDIAMPNLNGIEASRQLLAQQPAIKIIALSAKTDQPLIRQVFLTGIHAFISKMSAVDELIDCIHTVMEGERYLGVGFTHEILQGLLNDATELATRSLTAREKQILQLLAEGKSMKEIAGVLGVSIKTVETHRRAIMTKLNAYSIAELTKHAIREGLTSLD